MNSLCITGDYLYIIAKYLNPLDIINVSRALGKSRHDFQYLLRQSTMNKIDLWFRELYGDNKDFVRSMIESQAVISGSFILQMILNETWKTGIDIFFSIKMDKKIFHHHSTPIEEFLLNDVYSRSRDHNLQENLDHDIDTYAKLFDFYNNGGISIGHYHTRSEIFQAFGIRVNRNDLINLILNRTDFDICKNLFWYDENGCNIYMDSPNQIINKNFTGKTTMNPRYTTKEYRKKKYEFRGFYYKSK